MNRTAIEDLERAVGVCSQGRGKRGDAEAILSFLEGRRRAEGIAAAVAAVAP